MVNARLTDGEIAAGPAISSPNGETPWVLTASLTVCDQVELRGSLYVPREKSIQVFYNKHVIVAITHMQ